MDVSIMLNLKVMFIIGLLLIGLTAIAADEIESKQNEETLSILPLDSTSLSTTTTASSLFLSTSPSNPNNSSATPTSDATNHQKTSSNPSDSDHTTKNPNSDDAIPDKKMTVNSIQMKNQPATTTTVSMEKIFNEDDDDISLTKNKPVRVNGGGKQIDGNDDSNVPLVVAVTKQADIKGRALNLTDASFVNEMANRKAVEMVNYVTTQSSVGARGMEDLSDVSMDDDDDEDGENSMHHMHTHTEDAVIDVNECINNGKTYKINETMDRGCDQRCTCKTGSWICEPRCSGTMFKKGKHIDDPKCFERPSKDDECCAVMICDDEVEGSDGKSNGTVAATVESTCLHNGKTYKPKDRIEDGCDLLCTCEQIGNISCTPRCPKMNQTTSEKCVKVKDPKDSCCEIELCDVTLDDHEQSPFVKTVSTTSTQYEGSESWLSKLLVRRIEPTKEPHSRMLSDKEVIYALNTHNVRPDCMDKYLVNYKKVVEFIHSKKDTLNCELIGSWTVNVGDMDQCVHLWKYTGGFEAIDQANTIVYADQDYMKLSKERGNYLRSRHLQYLLAFSYWPQIESREGGHIYEMRSYRLKPGTMIEWGNNWARAINFRKTNNEAFAGFFSQVGRLYNVHHIWCYKSLQARKENREAAWRSPGWDECVAYTVPLIKDMHSRILAPTEFSPTQ